ncbi:helix-turn-helix domain-containing protein [Mycobacterium intracellulare]|uniref:helix-turn-helix domain-containing protein n=1 Tax=Mycobacterium intracellulare TaxID=1767 RepID=UPI002955B5DD|nr:helix-turn-helix domain-containing protein [Mycobacterium intracellulare]MDV6979607.1 helix-turn-helix domain-containing protein [Mycobacterium intracellulare]MDV6985110.1 helix-turn-helix domain-containing protein [Mycobacterium intracellulare]
MQGKHSANHDELLQPSEAAALVGVHRDTLKRWEAKGRITSLRTPDGHRRFRRRDVEALLTTPAEASA